MKGKPEGYAHLTAKIDQLKSELAKAVAAERERCAKECIAIADDFECDVNQRGLVDKMKQRFGVK